MAKRARSLLLSWLLGAAGANVALAASCHDWAALEPSGTGGAVTASSAASTAKATASAVTSSSRSATVGGSSSSSGTPDGGVGGSATTYRDVVLQAGPVAYYRFEEAEGAPIYDETTHYPGTASDAGLVHTAMGKVGSAIVLDGSQGEVSVPGAPQFLGNAPCSFEAWVLPSAMVDGYPRILGDMDNFFPHHGYVVNAGVEPADASLPGLLGFERYIGEGGVKNAAYPSVTPVLPMNTWSYVVATYDGLVMTLYLNTDNVAALGPNDASILPGAPPILHLGWHGDPGSGHFAGTMDELAIYDTVLTAQQMSEHFAVANSSP